MRTSNPALNDKTFQENQGGDENENKRGGGSQGVQGDGFNFGGLKGKLSLGPDPLTNSILISAEGEELMKIVENAGASFALPGTSMYIEGKSDDPFTA